MRAEDPGEVIRRGGDLDNRLKTLFDSLAVPKEDQIHDEQPGPDEDPFYCLLEDDGLITGFQVRTERLLKASAGLRGTDVHLDISVTVRPSKITHMNLRFLGGYL